MSTATATRTVDGLEAGGVLVGRQLKVEMSIQAVPEQPAA